METRIALFQKKEIRKTLHQNEWWFVITDVVAALTGSLNPAGYLKDMRRRDEPLADALKGGARLFRRHHRWNLDRHRTWPSH